MTPVTAEASGISMHAAAAELAAAHCKSKTWADRLEHMLEKKCHQFQSATIERVATRLESSKPAPWWQEFLNECRKLEPLPEINPCPDCHGGFRYGARRARAPGGTWRYSGEFSMRCTCPAGQRLSDGIATMDQIRDWRRETEATGVECGLVITDRDHPVITLERQMGPERAAAYMGRPQVDGWIGADGFDGVDFT